MRTASEDLLLILKTQGPSPVGALAARLGVSRQAARQQIDRLVAEGLVTEAGALGGRVGRPGLAWGLTDKGHARFPDTHARLTVELIDAVRAEFGDDGLDRLVARREQAAAETYAQALAGAADLEARLDRLAALRSAEGYMAEWRRESDGGYLLIENHCPICAAATACQGFCRAELELFRLMLQPAEVTRTDHLLAGARRCAYRVTPT